MTKKARKPRIDKIFHNARKKLPHYYLDDLSKLLVDVPRRQIIYAQEKKCKNLVLKKKVLDGMKLLEQQYEKMKTSLTQ